MLIAESDYHNLVEFTVAESQLLPLCVMGSQLLVRSFSRHGYALLLRHVDEVSYGHLSLVASSQFFIYFT